jgi:hypothetical protein
MTLYPNPAPALFDAFDPAGLAVEGVYGDGTARPLAASAYAFDPIPHPDWIGVKVITVRAKENPSLTARFQIAVDSSARVLNAISVENAKSTYFFGEPFDKNMLLITGHFSDGDDTVSADSADIVGYDKTKRGAQTVTVRVNGKSDSADVVLKIPADAIISSKSHKNVYIKGQDFDFLSARFNITANGVSAAVNGAAGDAISGYSPTTPGYQQALLALDDKTGIRADLIVIDAEPCVYFDYGYMRTAGDPDGKGSFNTGEAHFSAVAGRPLVLAPVRYLIGYNADSTQGAVSYAWSVVSGPATYESGDAASECFAFTPTAAGVYGVAVSVTGRNFITGETDTKTAETKVVCGGTGTAGSFASPLKNFAPGQFTERGAGAGWSLGSFGGYEVWHLGKTGDKFEIRGNPFSGWSEPGIVWVSYDDNGNNIPDDTWYELKGNHEGLPTTVKRYAITWRIVTDCEVLSSTGNTIEQSSFWADSQGRTGEMNSGWPRLYGVSDDNGAQVTYTGTLLCQGVLTPYGKNNYTGYVDAIGHVGNGLGATTSFSKSNAIQTDGSAVSLKGVSFVKVHTGVWDLYPTLGEISTEIYSAEGLGQQTGFPLP